MWRIVSLLSVLIGALCPAAEGRPLLRVNDTQQQYQAVEHSNITLTVLCPVNSSSDSLYIDLMSMESQRRIYLYDSKDLPDPYTDDRFKGRLQCDPRLRNGWIECLLSDLRLSDAGRYQWIVATKGRRNRTKLKLVVRVRKHDQDTSHSSVKTEDVKPPTQEKLQKPTQRGRFWMYPALVLFVWVVVCLIVKFCNCHPNDPPSMK